MITTIMSSVVQLSWWFN